MTWDKANRYWRFHFSEVKLKKEDAAASEFDELLLALYTPRGIYVYRHDLKHGLSAAGVKTAISGSGINVYGPTGGSNSSKALDAMLQKLDSSVCQRLGSTSLEDEFLSELAAVRPQSTWQV
ncbi:unnamed protein product [Polarella glacialis]|uniref:Uncharacterized protein n=1 Tax=Polarella glacialis TaxID=89957 RepID=A0A813DFR5_POLGL|nr:unnamed protein product [Polarella glacialis]